VNTQSWTLEYRRYVVSLRTMLAHPAGSNPWFQIPQVLDEITEVYPDVWEHAEKVESNNATFRSFLIRGKRSSPLKDRCPTKMYQVLIALGRGDLDSQSAKIKISAIFSAKS